MRIVFWIALFIVAVLLGLVVAVKNFFMFFTCSEYREESDPWD